MNIAQPRNLVMGTPQSKSIFYIFYIFFPHYFEELQSVAASSNLKEGCCNPFSRPIDILLDGDIFLIWKFVPYLSVCLPFFQSKRA